MGFFDKKKDQRTEIKETNVTNVDNRVGGDDGDNFFGGNISIHTGDTSNSKTLGAGGGGGDINIEQVDFGALDTAGDIAADSFAFSENAIASLSQTVGGSVEALRETARDAVDVADGAARDESARTMQFVVLGLTIATVAFFMRGSLKKVFKK